MMWKSIRAECVHMNTLLDGVKKKSIKIEESGSSQQYKFLSVCRHGEAKSGSKINRNLIEKGLFVHGLAAAAAPCRRA